MNKLKKHLSKTIKNMHNFMKCIFIHFWRFLTCPHIPLIFILSGFLFTAYLTYELSPKLNEQFEQQKIISGYITENLKVFNTSTREILAQISVYNRLKNQKEKEESKIDILKNITILQGQSSDLLIIFKNKASRDAVSSFQEKLENLRAALESEDSAEYSQNVIVHTTLLKVSSDKVFSLLIDRAGLNPDQKKPTLINVIFSKS